MSRRRLASDVLSSSDVLLVDSRSTVPKFFHALRMDLINFTSAHHDDDGAFVQMFKSLGNVHLMKIIRPKKSPEIIE